MRKISISDKLILVFLFVSTISIFIIGYYSFYHAKKAILERTFNQLTSVRVVKTHLVEKFFNDCIKEIQLVNSSSDIKKILAQINESDSCSNYEIINDSLRNLENEFVNQLSKKHYNRITIIGKNRKVFHLKSNADNTNQDYDFLWQQSIISDSLYINDLTKLSNLSQPLVTLSSKITDSSNQVVGILVFEISLKAINAIMLEDNPSNGLGISGESYLVGHDYLMRSSSRFQSNSVLKTIVKTEASIASFNNNPGTQIIKDYRGIEVLSSYSKINIPNLEWAILAEIDYEEATIPIYKIRNEILFISVFIFFMVLMVVIIVSQKITLPIKKLNHAAHEIGKGNFEIQIKHKLNDEIGELTDSFNKMANKLKEQSEELNSERIKSLSSLIDGQESERMRLSRELHDSLGQLLIGLKLKYESCLDQSKLTSETEDKFYELGLLFDKTIEETRRISNNLMPAALSEFGLVSAVRNICNEISETTKINILFKSEGNSNDIDSKIKTYLFRIIQEALTNILKHSQANSASIQLFFDKEFVKLLIEDDGVGFDKSNIKSQNSNGLNNIKDRVALLKGTCSVKSETLKGTQIHIEIPLRKKIL
ncbi:MAG TPA: hypothetical protein DDX39_03500 [Bacteroidales bacterium]|nr:MAG: hypothetical protein A2W98_12820 [Bacteroidetes bacterium GWF2_33_38]OFY75224.1 MAG: hypothetical protein A2265_11290 [Bacteroidetes bacterium RIFOXYA12_FULL_33_9]OFY91915.1 MAG: hypothetical protein A2236_13520 [Bacteroidetes bacterium RIFOXYA2_FULL_33_7]HBF87685.1 hypothetical protein [Bacteroidales bacterium]